MDLISFLLGLGIGIGVTAIALIFKLDAEKQAKTLARDTFKALSDDALKSNNQAFLDLAQSRLQALLNEAKGEIGERQEKLKGLVEPLGEVLKRYETQVQELENKRQNAYGGLDVQLKSLLAATGSLVSALRTPHVSGQWGQITLKRIVELAGMTEHCGYVEQLSVKAGESRLQPDMVVYLPGETQVVIDSKSVTRTYMTDYLEATDDQRRESALEKHAQEMRKLMSDLAAKQYWNQFQKPLEFVIMFVPAETFISAAMKRDPDLFEEAIQKRVIIAGPATLYTILIAFAYCWRQEQTTKNTQAIAALGREVYDRFGAFLANFLKMRNSIGRTVDDFNNAVGSLERRVLPSLRKVKELGATGADDLPVVEPIDQTPRQLNASLGTKDEVPV